MDIRRCFIALTFIMGTVGFGFSQKVLADTTYSVRSAMRTSQLVHVQENPENGNIRLVFRQVNQIQSKAFHYYEFSPDLRLLASEVEENEFAKEDYLRKAFPHYRGEFFTEEGFSVVQNNRIGSGNRIDLINYTDTYTWNWFFRDYLVRRDITNSRMMDRLQDEKYYLVHQFYHPGVDKVFALIAFKEKGKVLLTSGHSGSPLLDHYQLIRVDRDLNFEVLRDLQFPFKMELVTAKKLDWNDDEHFLGQERFYQIGDPSAKMLYVFAPAGGLLTGNKHPDRGAWTMFKVDRSGDIHELPLHLPGSGWKVMDVLHRNDTILLWGPAKNNRYHNALPVDPLNEISAGGIRYKGFQIVRIVGDKIDKISYRHFREFRHKADKQAKRFGISYRGREHLFSYAKMGPGGELFIGGQRIVESEVKEQGPNEGQTRSVTVRTGYRQPILFCFDSDLNLDRVYGYRYYRWLMRSNDAVSPMWVRRSAEGKWYWEVSELYDIRTYAYHTPLFDENSFMRIFGPSVYTSMNKYLFFPRIIPIDPSTGLMKDALNIGLNDKGRQRYYSDNFIPWKILRDGSVLYIGFDGMYNTIWLGCVKL